MAGVRTPTRQFSSCVLIESGDSLDSINATANAIVKYVSQRAGIGINGGRIRALGSPIRGGEAFHTGCIPFYKHFQSAVKRSEEHTSELQSRPHLVCRLLLEKKKKQKNTQL